MIFLICFLVISFLYIFLIFPSATPHYKKETFVRRNFAHRGLYDNEAGVPENSLAAFEAAMKAGYGCELDVQFTKDKKLIVFHDNDYIRACGVDKKVWDLTYDEISSLSLFGTEETIPTFREVLDTVDGRGPLIVEVKAEELNMNWYRELCVATKLELENYCGDFCMESFHPGVVRWVRFNMPDTVRGLLIEGKPSKGSAHSLTTYLLSLLLGNVICRPQFVAYNCEKRNLALRLAQMLGAFTVMWTCRTPEQQQELEKLEDCIIFEHYHPETHFTN